MIRSLAKVLGFACLASIAGSMAGSKPAEQSAQLFQGELGKKIHLPYLEFLPSNYNKNQQRRWPLILYLHGGSLRGDNVDRLRTLGLPHRLEQDRQFPFVVVTPLCAEGEIWTNVDALAQLVDHVISTNRIDEKRVYVTGHSMGGRGALYLAYKQPDRFAAVVAMSPLSPITAWAEKLANIPVWIIHGEKDTAAPIKDSEELMNAIEHDGGHPKFTRLADRDHLILDLYDKNEVFDWMAEHHR
jgi:predicted peptidase